MKTFVIALTATLLLSASTPALGAWVIVETIKSHHDGQESPPTQVDEHAVRQESDSSGVKDKAESLIDNLIRSIFGFAGAL